MLCDLAEDLLLSFEVADVDGPSAGVAVAAQPGGLGLDAVSGQVEQGDVGAVRAQGAGQASTEAAAGAGDRDGLAGQVEPHRVSLMVMTTLPLPPPAWRIGLSASRNSRTAGTNRSWYWKMPPCPESG